MVLDIQTLVILTQTLVIGFEIETLVMDILTLVMGTQTQGCPKRLNDTFLMEQQNPKKQHFPKICSVKLTRLIHWLGTSLTYSVFNGGLYCFPTGILLLPPPFCARDFLRTV